MRKLYKTLMILLASILIGLSAFGQTLSIGDIAFIGYNTDAPDGFTFITLTDIPASEQIYFSEQGWDGSSWIANTEGHVLYTAPASGLPCGTIVYIEESGSNIFTVTGGGTCNMALNSFFLSGGDQIIAYQSGSGAAPASPSFIAAIHGDYNSLNYNVITSWNLTSGATAESEIPTGLTNGVDCISLYPDPGPELDNSRYTGTLAGTADDLRALINNHSNWIGSNTSDTIFIAPGNYPVPNVNCSGCTEPDIPSLSASVSPVCSGNPSTITITGNLNDATAWQIYTDSCIGANIGSTASSTFVVNPGVTTTYYIRGEGGCSTPGSCGTVTINVNNSNSGSENITTCDTYIWSANNTTYTSSGIYTATLTNISGCDSVATLNLTINNSSSGSENITTCDTYTWSANNTTYTSSGIYTATLTNISGCDSVATLNLTINIVDTSISQSGATITANTNEATYQWLDCDNSYSIISGEISQIFIATSNGNFAVEIIENGCVDTSSCISVTNVSIENEFINDIKIYPNPTLDILTIEVCDAKQALILEICDINGEQLKILEMHKNIIQFNLSEYVSGNYILKASDKTGTLLKSWRIVKK